MSKIYHIAKADFLQRVRGYGFLIILGACIFAVYMYVPPPEADYATITIGKYRGIYNPAWIGSMVAMMSIIYLSLLGFYLVNNALQRDRDTGVGQIIAASPISRTAFLSAKLLSNFFVLFLMTLVMVLMTILMFFLRAETRELELWQLVSPLFILTVPAVFIVAALAVIFEVLFTNKRNLINILYFFLWYLLLIIPMFLKSPDVLGTFTPLQEIKSYMYKSYPDYSGKAWVGFQSGPHIKNRKIFLWKGPRWSYRIFGQRLLWILVILGLFGAAALKFKRFDPAYYKHRIRGKPTALRKWLRWPAFLFIRPRQKSRENASLGEEYSPLPCVETHFGLWPLVKAELIFMFKGVPGWLYLVNIGLFAASIFAPLPVAHKILLPVLWFLHIPVWSKIGCKERMFRTTQYVFAAAYPIKRQLTAQISAAVLMALAAAGPVIVKSLIAGNFYNIYAIITGAVFLPSLAFTLGAWTGGSKLFEVIYTILFFGMINGAAFMDYLGTVEKSHSNSTSSIFLGTALVLWVLAIWGRRYHIKH